jgi:hypothetical protein
LYRHFQRLAYTSARNTTLLDMKQGDVNGDGIIDNVYLYGNKPEGTGSFADNITLVIQDGHFKGEVLSLGTLYPIVTNGKRMNYDLLAFQRIIGNINSDTLGYVENLLTWNGTQFISSGLSVAIPVTKLISLY